MKKMLYANGDSFTFGMEILGDFNRTEQNKDYAYPVELSKLMGIDTTINAAYCGAPNEFIVRKTIIDLLQLEKEGYAPKDTFVVIGWSSVSRVELYLQDMVDQVFKEKNFVRNDGFVMPELDDFGTAFMNPGFTQGIWFSNGEKKNLFEDIMPTFVNYVWHDELEFEKWMIQYITLSSYLTAKGYDFVFFNGVHQFSEYKIKPEIADVTMPVIDNPNFFNTNWFSFVDWATENFPMEQRKGHHFSGLVHQEFAKMLYQYIIENKLI